MKTTVTHAPPVPPPQRIVLELDAEEFMAIFALVYTGATGHTPLRSEIERGILQAADSDPFLRKASKAFAEDRDRGYVFARVDRALKAARS